MFILQTLDMASDFAGFLSSFFDKPLSYHLEDGQALFLDELMRITSACSLFTLNSTNYIPVFPESNSQIITVHVNMCSFFAKVSIYFFGG
jgi:hypothetical protein